MIGIAGGIGPYAGLDLARKIFDNTIADKDQEHLPVLLHSIPSDIKDRTEYLLSIEKENPGHAIARVLLGLERSGATVCGIACNTAHAEKIFDVILDKLKRSQSNLKVLSLIEETVSYIRSQYAAVTKVGVLSTSGTYKFRLYAEALQRKGFQAILPPENMQNEVVHEAIYDPEYGIKACSNPVTERAKKDLLDAFSYLKKQGAEAVILGCTEIPLAIGAKKIQGVFTIDPALALARALIYHFAPQKLIP